MKQKTKIDTIRERMVKKVYKNYDFHKNLFLKIKKNYLFLAVCVFIPTHRLSLVANGLFSTWGAQASNWCGFSCCRTYTLGMWALVVEACGL